MLKLVVILTILRNLEDAFQRFELELHRKPAPETPVSGS